MREVTDAKRAQERLLHDAVHDSLSGLPNRELFLDRLAIAAKRADARAAGAAGAAVHRHRQVQDRQHVVRAGGRRQPAADRRPPAGPQPRTAGHARPRRRRPVRAAAAQPVRSARAGHAGRAGAPLAARAHQHRRPGDRAHRLDRHRALRRARRGPRRAAARGRDRHVPRQARAAPTASRSSTPSMRTEKDGRAGARERPAARHREEAAQARLPADLLSADRDAGGLRGAAALGAPAPRHAQPHRFRARGGGVRPDRQARLLRAGPCRARGGCAGRRSCRGPTRRCSSASTSRAGSCSGRS